MDNADNIMSLRVPLQRDEAISLKNIYSKYFILIFAAVFLLLILPGCGSLSFYTQAIHGQYKILTSRQPIDKLIANPDTPADLKNKLQRVLDIRSYAIQTLKLPGEDNYLTYVDIKQPYAVWAVFAAPEYSIHPKTWCYPIIGCAAYRGYFKKEDAEAYANHLKDHGYDVCISGAKAYSTLGWFDDPILSTFLDQGDIHLAALIFHELAHHIFYVKDDTTFNESFAQTVEQEGLRRWLNDKHDPDGYKRYLAALKRQEQFTDLITKYQQKLDQMYQKTTSIPEKKERKAQIFNHLKTDYQSLKKKWNGFSGYDEWFETDLNNAKLITIAAYNDLVPAFQNILNAEGGDLERFYKTCVELSEKPKNERMYFLEQYSDK